ncbi:MAG: hypothetical protein B5M46_00180 [Epsilonproteobacteria bacterium 4484_20]|nr:MAG: hypothetical protein B5M46_00180 [Epsilonproteobacteria bacterium 4484_20]
MQKIFIFLLLFLLSGCSVNDLMVWGEINKVQVVKQNAYVKHYRAYFKRDHLQPIRNGKRYLYFYNKRTEDLAILLHPGNRYLLYSFSHPHLVIKIPSDRKHGYYHMLKVLKRKGYYRIVSPHTAGYTAHVSLRRYKKVRTYLVEVKDYRHLQNLYREAIRTYDAKKIEKIKTKLPNILIGSYYEKYKAQAATQEQLKQLDIISAKLHSDEETQARSGTEAKNDTGEQLYSYYLKDASYYELSNYLATSEAKSTLSYSQYNTLKSRNSQLREKDLLENGSLEELITAYKKNQDPRYKSKIMQRIKEIQKN